MFKKLLAMSLVVVMALSLCVSMTSCDKADDEFKIGVILLHDEASTYDLNFIEAVERAAAELGLDESQVLYKKNS